MTTITPQLTLGAPQVAGALAVFPVLGPAPVLLYRSFSRAIEHGAFVKELDRGASVGDLQLENPTDLPLLVYEGEEVLGAQQNRTFDTSILVPAGGRAPVPVSCMEQGRWDGRRAAERFAPSPQAADPAMRRVKRQAANLQAAAGATPRADQHEVWREVGDRLTHHGVASDSSAMSDLYDGRRTELDQMARAVRHVDGQVGAVVEVAGRPVALDLVSRADVFSDLLPRLAQGYALEALGVPVAPADEQAAQAFADSARQAPRAPQPTPGAGRAFGLLSPEIVGSGLAVKSELTQLCAFPAEPGEQPDPPVRGGRIARPARRRRLR